MCHCGRCVCDEWKVGGVVKRQVGFRFLNYQYEEQMVWGFNTYRNEDRYVVNDPNKDDDRVYGTLISESDMDVFISKQEEFKQGIALRQERAELHRLKELEEKEQQRNRENLFGFDSKLTPMQRGKIQKVLMKEINYKNDDGKVIYCATRKDFIIYLLSVGYTPEEYIRKEQKKVANYNNACRVKSMEWETYTKHGFEMRRTISENQANVYAVTKTEYEFAKYMIDTKQLA